MINLLVWIGFCRRIDFLNVRWPFHIPPKWVLSDWKAFKAYARFTGGFYVFRNLPGIIKWEKGRLLPRRWGFGIWGFEFGDRG